MTRSVFASFVVLVILFGGSANAAGQSAESDIQRLSLRHYMDMESVTNPQISPDGTRIVYTRGWVDKVNDSRESSLWIMDADGSRNRQLVEGSDARWSPDGTRILYTGQGEPEGSQIFVRWMDAEGSTTQITRLERAPSNARWSPDGESVAFTSRMDDQAEFAGVSLPTRPDGAAWTAEPKVVERAGYRRDRTGYIDTGWTHLFVVPADGGTARQLTDGDWNHNGVAWSPDGSEIYFSSYRDDAWDRPAKLAGVRDLCGAHVGRGDSAAHRSARPGWESGPFARRECQSQVEPVNLETMGHFGHLARPAKRGIGRYKRCRFNRSVQQCPRVYPPASDSRVFCEVWCSGVAQSHRGTCGCSQTGPSAWGSTVAASRWCSRWNRAATDSAGRRSTPAPPSRSRRCDGPRVPTRDPTSVWPSVPREVAGRAA